MLHFGAESAFLKRMQKDQRGIFEIAFINKLKRGYKPAYAKRCILIRPHACAKLGLNRRHFFITGLAFAWHNWLEH